MSTAFADKIQMQNLLFSELSLMFSKEVPLYDKSLLVNQVCNETICKLLSQFHKGFHLTAEELEKTSGERHGAIRIGKPSEYQWVAAFFEAFGMEPHNFYDMTNVGSKSQPIIATAFRSSINPDHRIFCSLLMTDYFDPQTRKRIEDLLAPREVFSAKAKELCLKSRRQNGLEWEDARELIREGTTSIFKWTGRAKDHQLYQDLSKAGFKIAADIACFENHHLNHLTPNTLCMDLYTAAMKFCLGELPAEVFCARAEKTLKRFRNIADRDYMKLHFKHLNPATFDAYPSGSISDTDMKEVARKLTNRLGEADLQLNKLNHSGFKDFTEGPPEGFPILLRQDAYKALTEPVTFRENDGTEVKTTHTARFGEIEQRFYATTPAGREMYDRCLASAEVARAKTPGLAKENPEAYEKAYADAFAEFPNTLKDLLARKLVYGRFSATKKGIETGASGGIQTTDLQELIHLGYVQTEGLRYEDFLPVSAAGIFASNLGQYGTKSTASEKPVYTREMLEKIMGKRIVESDLVYRGLEAQSILKVYEQLGLLAKFSPSEKTQLESYVAASTCR